MGVAVLQGISIIIPLLHFIPTAYVRWLCGVVAREAGSFLKFTPAYETILDDVKDLVKKNRDDELVVTGHSLGGLLASIVTARLKLDQKEETIPNVPIRSV